MKPLTHGGPDYPGLQSVVQPPKVRQLGCTLLKAQSCPLTCFMLYFVAVILEETTIVFLMVYKHSSAILLLVYPSDADLEHHEETQSKPCFLICSTSHQGF